MNYAVCNHKYGKEVYLANFGEPAVEIGCLSSDLEIFVLFSLRPNGPVCYGTYFFPQQQEGGGETRTNLQISFTTHPPCFRFPDAIQTTHAWQYPMTKPNWAGVARNLGHFKQTRQIQQYPYLNRVELKFYLKSSLSRRLAQILLKSQI